MLLAGAGHGPTRRLLCYGTAPGDVLTDRTRTILCRSRSKITAFLSVDAFACCGNLAGMGLSDLTTPWHSWSNRTVG